MAKVSQLMSEEALESLNINSDNENWLLDVNGAMGLHSFLAISSSVSET